MGLPPPATPARARPMKRLVAKLVLFLLAGSIINVAVACGCLTCTSRWRYETTVLYLQTINWNSQSPDLEPFNPESPPNPVLKLGRSHWYEMELTRHGVRSSIVMRIGWPLLTLETKSIPSDRLTNAHGPRLFLYFNQPRWLGFAINTIFYAAMLCLLF